MDDGILQFSFRLLADYPERLQSSGVHELSPAVGAVSWTWNCDPFECVGQGTGDVISGLVGGVILFDGATFNGLVLGGTFEEDKIIDLITWSAVRRYTNLQSGIFRVLDERVVHRRRRLGGNRSQWKANQQPSTDSLLA